MTQQTNDRDQTKVMEEKEHSILNILDYSLHINKNLITSAKAKKKRSTSYAN